MMLQSWLDPCNDRPLWRVSDGDAQMIVPDVLRKCVCFIYFDDEHGVRRPAGTAFVTCVPRTHGREGQWVYLVTANHILNGIRARRPDGAISLRFNLVGGGVHYASSHVDQWLTHPDRTLVDDVAILPWAPPAELVEYLVFPLSEAVSETTGHGVGDEVFLPGLFFNHEGRERNIPIVRVGNIAAMPDEPVSSEIGPLDAYLVEARSIGGLSGSPVFVNLGLHRKIDGQLMQAGGDHNVVKLLGMMHGHYQVRAPQADEATVDGLTNEAINMGIAIVVPIDRVAAVIHQPDLVDSREKEDRKEAAALLPVMDGATKDGDEFESFEDALSKLAQVPKSEVDELRKKEK